MRCSPQHHSDTSQLQLELEPQAPNPNAWMFSADGSPKRLLWCSDNACLGGPCPYAGSEMPLGICCKDLVAAPAATPTERSST